MDSLQLTPSARTLGDAEAPVDSHRVEKLREAIADGSYRVDADRIAGKLLDIERLSRKD
jgi:negative regulator of flagellin synthesis FlgM